MSRSPIAWTLLVATAALSIALLMRERRGEHKNLVALNPDLERHAGRRLERPAPTAAAAPAHPEPIPVARPLEVIERPNDAPIRIERHAEFTAYRFLEPLARVRVLSIDVQPGAVAAADRVIALSAARPTGPGTSSSIGTYLLTPESGLFERIAGWAADLTWDGSRLWLAQRGARTIDFTSGAQHTLRQSDGLQHDAVAAITIDGDRVWLATRGDYDKGRSDFLGGGVSMWQPTAERFTSWTLGDGLARAYSSDIAADDREVWVAHWDEDVGVSVLDIATSTWSALRRSENRLDRLGGPVVALDDRHAWIGQQGGLVRIDRTDRVAQRWTTDDGLPGTIVSAIAIGRSAVWIGLYTYGADGGASATGVVAFPRG